MGKSKDLKKTSHFWIGNFKNKTLFKDFLKENHKRKYISNFAKSQGEKWIDHDFLEAGIETKGKSVREKFADYSWAENWMTEFEKRLKPTGLKKINSIIMLTLDKTSDPVKNPCSYKAEGIELVYLGKITFISELSIENLIIAAKKNDPHAQQRLGEKYRFGFGVKEDVKKCEYWYLKALESGVKDAHFSLFLLYYREEKLMDMKKAWFHLQEAVNSDKPHPNSFLSMAKAYTEEKLTAPNKIEATKWLLIAQCNVGYWKDKLNDLKKILIKEEWKKAETMAKEWKAKHKA